MYIVFSNHTIVTFDPGLLEAYCIGIPGVSEEVLACPAYFICLSRLQEIQNGAITQVSDQIGWKTSSNWIIQ